MRSLRNLVLALGMASSAIGAGAAQAAFPPCPAGSRQVIDHFYQPTDICEQIFDASGEWTVPDKVSAIDVIAVGGGGGGGGGGADYNPGI